MSRKNISPDPDETNPINFDVDTDNNDIKSSKIETFNYIQYQSISKPQNREKPKKIRMLSKETIIKSFKVIFQLFTIQWDLINMGAPPELGYILFWLQVVLVTLFSLLPIYQLKKYHKLKQSQKMQSYSKNSNFNDDITVFESYSDNQIDSGIIKINQLRKDIRLNLIFISFFHLSAFAYYKLCPNEKVPIFLVFWRY